MNLQKIQGFVKDEATFLWIKGIIQFLNSVFGEDISHEQAVALMQVITRFTITLQDGTIINAIDSHNRSVWLVDAAAIASVLCATPDKDPGWWKIEFSSFDKETADYDNLVSAMVEAIRTFPKVSAIEAL